MTMARLFAVSLSVLCWTSLAQAVTLNLNNTLAGVNIDFEDDLIHSQWTATTPNLQNYTVDSPEVNPVIYPNNPLQAFGGANFIGILNLDDDNQDLNGKLVHDAIPLAGSFGNGTVFRLQVCATRGHLGDDPPNPGDDPFSPVSGKPSPEVMVQFFAWKAGTTPAVDADTDHWSRTPTFSSAKLKFTNWDDAGFWACQTFSATYNKTPPAKFVSVGISGINHRTNTYVAFDIP